MLDKLITIKLDKERHLRLTLKGMIEFRNVTGKDLLQKFNLKDMSIEDSAALLWACLIHEDKELAYDDVLYMVDLSNITKVMTALQESVEQALTKTEEETNSNPLVEAPQPG